eukprot:TRINITY_DN4343_c0_g1_i1.p1 TRINITY_DN4343_c0_g1~~TRINITY_DN4343_c0_g1_i1.p1  ORF type:complete len:696 (+),score=216.64 TRINITY_DN4343_c0_g1_i1:85-2088(+)
MQELKEGLQLETVDLGSKRRRLVLHNTSTDRQFVAKYKFKGGEPEALGTTEKAPDGRYVLSVHPGEALPFAEGLWTGVTKAIASGPCSKEWKEQRDAGAKGSAEAACARASAALAAAAAGRDAAELSAAERAALLAAAGVPFVDLSFPPKDCSLKQEWQRGQMHMLPFVRAQDWGCVAGGPAPVLYASGRPRPDDVNQGALADCYLMGALGSVAVRPELIERVFPDGLGPNGAISLRLCLGGWWRTVVIDDWFPCSGPKPGFARNRAQPHELWVAAVEKALAKACGGYHSLKTGQCAQALADVAGCPQRTKAVSPDLWEQLVQQHSAGALHVFGTPGKNLMYVEAERQSAEDRALWERYRGRELICEHSYSLLRCLKLPEHAGGERLCLLRNPWGTTQHGLWKGPWAAGAAEWTPEAREAAGYSETEGRDGYMWMAWGDCCEWFTSLSIGYAMRSWAGVRVQAQWTASGAASVILVLSVKRPCRAFAAVQHPDARGVRPAAGAAPYPETTLGVVRSRGGAAVQVVDSASSSRRDLTRELSLRPLAGGRPAEHFVFAQQQSESADGRPFAYSIVVEHPDAVTVTFREAAEHPGAVYADAKSFQAADWRPCSARFQLQGAPWAGEGELCVREAEGPRAPILEQRTLTALLADSAPQLWALRMAAGLLQQ